MGLWVNTTYVNEARVGTVAEALTALVEAEGLKAIAPPPWRDRLLVEPMQYEPASRNDLWGVALFPGAAGWTVIQTAPLELLGERAPGGAQMRLAALSRALSVPAFQFNVYDGAEAILAEVAPGGAVVVSGINPRSRWGDPLEWNGERIGEADFQAGFRLLPFAALTPAGRLAEDTAMVLARRFGGGNARFCDNIVSIDTLICHAAFDALGGLVRYYAWPGPSRQRFAPLASWAEYRALGLGREGSR